MKTCRKCGELKPCDAFYVHSKATGKLRNDCKACTKATVKENQPEGSRVDYSRSYYARHGETVRAKQRERLYGITEEQYQEILESQGHKCAICGTTDPQHYGRFVIDHCHTTGKVRGLLCNHCNRGLGAFMDNRQSLLSAINYLNQHG